MRKFKKITSAVLSAALLASMALPLTLTAAAAATEADLTETTKQQTTTVTDPAKLSLVRETSDVEWLWDNSVSYNASDSVAVSAADGQIVTTNKCANPSVWFRGMYVVDQQNTADLAGKTIAGYSYEITAKLNDISALAFQASDGTFVSAFPAAVAGNTQVNGTYLRTLKSSEDPDEGKKVTEKSDVQWVYNDQALNQVNNSDVYNWKIRVDYTVKNSVDTAIVTFTAVSKADGTSIGQTHTREISLKDVQNNISAEITSVVPAIGFRVPNSSGTGSYTYTNIVINAYSEVDYTADILSYINAHPILADIKADTAFNAETYKTRVSEAQGAVTAYAALSAELKDLIVANGYYDAAKLQTIVNLEAATAEATAYMAANTIVNEAVTVTAENADTVYVRAEKAIAEYALLSEEAKVLVEGYDEIALRKLQVQAGVYTDGYFEDDFSDPAFSNAIWQNTTAEDYIEIPADEIASYSYEEKQEGTQYQRIETAKGNLIRNTITFKENSLNLSQWGQFGAQGGDPFMKYLGKTRLYTELAGYTGAAPETIQLKAKVDNHKKQTMFYVRFGDAFHYELTFKPDTSVTEGEIPLSVKVRSAAPNNQMWNHSDITGLVAGTVADGVYTAAELEITLAFKFHHAVENMNYYTVVLGIADAKGNTGSVETLKNNPEQVEGYGISTAGIAEGMNLCVKTTEGESHTAGLTFSSIRVDYFSEALGRAQVTGSTMKVNQDIENQNLRFNYTFDTAAALPENYSVVSYGALFMTNASLNNAYDLLTADYIGKNGAIIARVNQAVTQVSEIPGRFYVEVNGTALGENAVNAEKAGSRVASRAFVVYKNNQTNQEYVLYSNADSNGSDSSTKTVDNGQINRSLIGCAKNIIKMLVTQKPEYAENEIWGGMSAADYVASVASTTAEQKAAIVDFVTANREAIQDCLKG